MSSKWLRCVYQKSSAEVRLICFPWAGGGAAFYANWGKKFAGEIEVHGVCLPGRESRFVEPFIVDDWKSLLKDFCKDVHGILKEKPFAFWGHSLGAGICFEAARYLKLHYNMQPVHMLISSATAPQIPRTVLDVSVLSDDELIHKIRSWGGTPKALTENKDMMKIAVRVLRADLTLLHNYRYGNRPLPLDLSSVHMMTGMIIMLLFMYFIFFFLLFALLWTTEWCLFQFNSNPRFQKALIAVFCAPKSSPSLPHRAKSCSMPDIISLLRCAISNSLFYSQIPRTVLDVSVLSDDELIQKIRSWGGTPKALTENKDMMKIAVRVLRADLTLLHNYRFEADDNAILDCSLTCFDGSEDLHNQDGWTELIQGPFKRHVLPGGHFYFMERDNERSVIKLVSAALGVQ
ncbi:S-acyl fatty acid synthase thioesterase, medium chain-like [Orbicella faveolata]|uniref:S-acyl fatty acid synthase thioesterase, medium chain-like n=1 Tax=Orbicella faveolata TaxID=48498 RepID=UPI0009E5C60B|nr:S-acyl fatty acid synthase thioesterase, medium chain-like [Orbicella faveolata]